MRPSRYLWTGATVLMSLWTLGCGPDNEEHALSGSSKSSIGAVDAPEAGARTSEAAYEAFQSQNAEAEAN